MKVTNDTLNFPEKYNMVVIRSEKKLTCEHDFPLPAFVTTLNDKLSVHSLTIQKQQYYCHLDSDVNVSMDIGRKKRGN